MTMLVLGNFVSAIAALPVFQVYKTNQAITLDGKPTEAIWDKVDSVMRIKIIKTSGTPTANDTSAVLFAKVLFDSTRLYFYFWVDEKYLWDTITGYDAWGLWNQKVAEVFIDDSGDDKNFVEYNFGINGAVADFFGKQKYYANAEAAVGSDQRNCVFQYNSHPGVGIYKKGTLANTGNPLSPFNTDIDTGFGMEIAIPLDSLKRFGPATARVDVLGPKFHVPPRNRDSLRVNLYYAGRKPGTQNNLFWEWSTAAAADFHDTKNFGKFYFIDTVAHGTTTTRAVQSTTKHDQVNVIVSSERLTVILPNERSRVSGMLYDVSGTALPTLNRIEGNRLIMTMDQKLSAGTYIVRVQFDGVSAMQKVVLK